MLVLGTPTAPSSSSRVIKSPNGIIGQVSTALPIGREALKRLGGIVQEVSEKKGADSLFPEEKIVIPVGITPQTLKNYTLYDVLGFSGEWGAAADTEVIKKAYHKAVLMYHPDKAQFKTSDGKEDRTVFLKIQEAFNVLSNETKRRAYDSQLPFDESIPSEEKIQKGLAKGPHKFFKLFSPVFQRNARFAVQKPVPDLGDMDTPIDQVYKFYEYWVKFESWRDFTGVGAEHKPDDAGSREEKRWMQKENEKIAKRLKKKEMERLINLVSTAEKYDPRIVADKEQRKQAKEAERNAKESNLKRKADEEAAAKEWAEKEAEAALSAKGSTKEEREKIKKQQSKCRNILKKLLRHSVTLGQGSLGEYGVVSDADLELLCANCNMDELNKMNNSLGGEPASKDSALVQVDGYKVVLNMVEKMRARGDQAAEDEKIAKDARKREHEEKASPRGKKGGATGEERQWKEDELVLLETAVERYPAGFNNRWAWVTDFMNVKAQPTPSFTADECLIGAYRLTLKSA